MKHPQPIQSKIAKIEKSHKLALKRIIKSNPQMKEEIIRRDFYYGIGWKKNHLKSFHPGSDSFVENIFIQISRKYDEILDTFHTGHLNLLNHSLDIIKEKLLRDFHKDESIAKDSAEVRFIKNFSINQALNFIARNIVYEKMLSDSNYNTETKSKIGFTINNQTDFEFPEDKAEIINGVNQDQTNSIVITENEYDDKFNSNEVARLSFLENKIKQLETNNLSNKLLTAAEAAEFTGFSINTIRQKTSDRTIPFIKLPNSSAVRYSPQELLEWMQSRNNKATSLLKGMEERIIKNKRRR